MITKRKKEIHYKKRTLSCFFCVSGEVVKQCSLAASPSVPYSCKNALICSNVPQLLQKKKKRHTVSER